MMTERWPWSGLAGLVVAAAVAIPGCNLVRGNGNETSEQRDHEDFTSISVGSIAHTSLMIGEEFMVAITCDSNLLSYIESRVEGDELIVVDDPEVSLSSSIGCHLDIEMPAVEGMTNSGSGPMRTAEVLVGLQSVRNTGSGGVSVVGAVNKDGEIEVLNSGDNNVRIRGIEAASVVATLTDKGQVLLGGVVTEATYNNHGRDSIHATTLEAQSVTVNNTNRGDVIVYASEAAYVQLRGSGDVVVHGRPPARDVINTGSGDVEFP